MSLICIQLCMKPIFFLFYNLQLNEVYSKSDRLSKWYRKVRIDSFSQGSVLVDYFVELADVSRDINTQEIRQMFHDALTMVPVSVVPLNGDQNTPDADSEGFNNNFDSDFDDDIRPQQIRDNYLLGKFVLDPAATDFIGKYRSMLLMYIKSLAAS